LLDAAHGIHLLEYPLMISLQNKKDCPHRPLNGLENMPIFSLYKHFSFYDSIRAAGFCLKNVTLPTGPEEFYVRHKKYETEITFLFISYR
jgi:hypothetical protein